MLIMKYIFLLVFILLPTLSYGKIGDVYYCEASFMTVENGKLERFKPQKFKFKKNANDLTFGTGTGYFNKQKFTGKVKDWDSQEVFRYVERNAAVLVYNKGDFYFTTVTYDTIVVSYGKCSVF
jgi:hypothetical protein